MTNSKTKIAISGASSPLGKVLKKALPLSSIKNIDIKLLDQEELEGTLTEYDGGVELIKGISLDTLKAAELIFLTGDAETNDDYIQQMSELPEDEKPFIIDGSIRNQPAALINLINTDSKPKAGKPLQLVHPLASGLIGIIYLIEALGVVEAVTANVAVPVSEFGSEGIKALHNQLVELMNFGNVKGELFAKQLIFNTLPSMGPITKSNFSDYEDAVNAQVKQNIKGDKLELITSLSPTFYSYNASLTINLSKEIDPDRLTKAFANADGFELHESKDLPDPLTVTDSQDIHIGRIHKHRADGRIISISACWDNIMAGSVRGAISLAEQILK